MLSLGPVPVPPGSSWPPSWGQRASPTPVQASAAHMRFSHLCSFLTAFPIFPLNHTFSSLGLGLRPLCTGEEHVPRVQIPAPPLTGWVVRGKFLELRVPPFSHLQEVGQSCVYVAGGWGGTCSDTWKVPGAVPGTPDAGWPFPPRWLPWAKALRPVERLKLVELLESFCVILRAQDSLACCI